jgi:hypothetical protein
MVADMGIISTVTKALCGVSHGLVGSASQYPMYGAS